MRPCALLAIALLLLLLQLNFVSAAQDESVCYGTTGRGRLEGGVELPYSGDNFGSYSYLGNLLGRTFVHSSVCRVVVGAYERIAGTHPDTIYMYGETGKRNGGPIKPHKTHQNGLSVDFMVPVLDADGRSVPLPTGPFNKFGYAIEFDGKGRFGDYSIDYPALAAHLVALSEEADEAGIAIRRVIFDPKLQPFLFATEYGDYLRNQLTFSKSPSWVRHDEHYHVDFKLECRPLP